MGCTAARLQYVSYENLAALHVCSLGCRGNGSRKSMADLHLRLQGGFIWDWVDQGLMRKGRDWQGNEVEFWGYGGDWNEPVHDGQFNINGLIWPDRTPHPTVLECKQVMVRSLDPAHALL